MWMTVMLDGGQYLQKSKNSPYRTVMLWSRPPLRSSGQSFCLQIQRSRVRSPALPDFLSSSGSGTGSTQPREVKLRSYLNQKVVAPGSENRD